MYEIGAFSDKMAPVQLSKPLRGEWIEYVKNRLFFPKAFIIPEYKPDIKQISGNGETKLLDNLNIA